MKYFPRFSLISTPFVVASVVFLSSFVLHMSMDRNVQQPPTDMAANALKNVVVVGGSYVGKVN